MVDRVGQTPQMGGKNLGELVAVRQSQQELLRSLSEQVSHEFAGITIDVTVISQYRNMANGLSREPRAVTYAQQAHERLGRVARMTTVRGGTDGSQLTEKGLPTPNLSSGQHNPHSPLEWACLDEMVQAVEVLVELAQVWAGSSVQPDEND